MSEASGNNAAGAAPLADRMRPRSLRELIGQEHLSGPSGPLARFLAGGVIPSMILWGPPGSGKTTLARLIGQTEGYVFEQFSAVLSGVREVRGAVDRARERMARGGPKTILFVDEIHRFHRGQQDAFLPHVESGLIVLVGATTENPSFEVNSALLSRCRVFVLKTLAPEALRRIGEAALADPIRGMGKSGIMLDEEAWSEALAHAEGDARRLLNLLEIAAHPVEGPPGGSSPTKRVVTAAELRNLLQRRVPRRLGDEDHYDWISALIKSLRGSDPDAGLYWLARMLEAGEDPRFIARRLIIFASEDIGLAEPGALAQTIAAKEAVLFVGMPECSLALSQAVLYCALAPKSNSAYVSYQRTLELIRGQGPSPVPDRLRNAPTRLMKALGHGQGYRYPHDAAGRFVPESYLPDSLRGRSLYRHSIQGREPRMVDDHRRRTGDFFRIAPEEPPEAGGFSRGTGPDPAPSSRIARSSSPAPASSGTAPDTGPAPASGTVGGKGPAPASGTGSGAGPAPASDTASGSDPTPAP